MALSTLEFVEDSLSASSRVSFRLYVRPWSPTGGGVIGNLSEYSPASVFPTRKRGRYYILKDDNHGAEFCFIPLQRRLSPDRLPF